WVGVRVLRGAVLPRLTPLVHDTNLVAACTVTLLRLHQHVLRIGPGGPLWLVRPAAWCAPPALLAQVLWWERALGLVLLGLLLARRPGRRLLLLLWSGVQGGGRLVPGTTYGTARSPRWSDRASKTALAS